MTLLIRVLTMSSLLVCAPLWAQQSPTEAIDSTVSEVLNALGQTQWTELQKRDRVFEIVGERFDFDTMARSALAIHWRKATNPERSRFSTLFAEVLSHTYWSRIKGHGDNSVELVEERLTASGKAVVKTLIVTDTRAIPVDYRMTNANGNWRVYDVMIEGVSLVRNYRSDYQQVVSQYGISGLLERMQEKMDSLRTQ